MWFLLLLPLFIGTKAQFVSQNGDKCSRGYICPPEFLRINQNCYYFSKNISTWDEAYYTCQDLHGRLAILRNADQDRTMRNFLSKISLIPVEIWIGGRYDWEQMTWKWGQTGREIKYKGFSRMDPDSKEKLQWHCIVLDPELQYKWNSRSCLEEKHFICQTKIKPTTSDERDKFKKKHNKKLNEIPLPNLPNEVYKETTNYKEYSPNGINVNNKYGNVLKGTSFAFTNSTAFDITRRNRPKSKRFNRTHMLKDGTIVVEEQIRKKKDRHDKSQEDLQTKVYYGGVPKSPLHPRVLTEEFGFR